MAKVTKSCDFSFLCSTFVFLLLLRMIMNKILFLLLVLVCCLPAYAQVNYGGTPYYPSTLLRSTASESLFVMPKLDADSLAQEREYESDNLRGAYTFAHKFHTTITKSEAASPAELPDGTKVWTIKIHSEGAYSLNFLLENVSFPAGGRLFLYNEDKTHVIGAFDCRSVSDSGMLPIRPVAGETITLEYSEPSDAPFEGDFTVTEVNHDYMDFLRTEPQTDTNSAYKCMADVLCSPADEQLIRSTVLLIIGGSTACSGTLINNSANDGKPYVITAVHCLNTTMTVPQTHNYYINRAGTIVTFFNYNKPVCGETMKGTQEMSIAGATAPVVLEKNDVLLLKLKEEIPTYYNPYFAGWTRSESRTNSPFTNLHHPNATVKKAGFYDSSLIASSYVPSPDLFDKDIFWTVSAWTEGSTHGGSSGSGLFDAEGKLVGTLTGGVSVCKGNAVGGGSDYFTCFYKAWNPSTAYGSLKDCLTPGNTGSTPTSCEGYDPFEESPVTRLSNSQYNTVDALVDLPLPSSQGYVFGYNIHETVEFAEAFQIAEGATIYGVYFLLPKMQATYVDGVEISVYSGSTFPETKLYSQLYHPQYQRYTTSGGFTSPTKSTSVAGTENFIHFNTPVAVEKQFYIAFRIDGVIHTSFRVYNAEFRSPTTNYAWVKENDIKWLPASEYTYFKQNTSLAIEPVVIEKSLLSIDNPEADHTVACYYSPQTGSLHLKETPSDTGCLELYDISGRKIKQLTIEPGKTEYHPGSFPKGTFGVVRIHINDTTEVLKIIF